MTGAAARCSRRRRSRSSSPAACVIAWLERCARSSRLTAAAPTAASSAGSSSRPRRGVRGLPRRAPAVAPGGPGAASRRRGRSRDPARCRSPRRCCSRPTPGRTGSTAASPPSTTAIRTSTRRAEFPDDPAYEYAGAAWRETTSVYGPAFTPRLRGGRARVGLLGRRGRLDLQADRRAAPCSRCMVLAARLARDRARRGGARRLESRCSRSTSPAAVTTTRCMVALDARRPRARGDRPPRPGRRGLGRSRCWSNGFRASSSPSARSRRAPPAAASATSASAVTAALVLGLATWRYGFDWLRAIGPLARNAEEPDELRACPTGSSSSGLPHAVSRSALRARARAPASPGSPGRLCAGEPRLGLAACLLLVTTPWLTPWYTVWAVPLAAAEDDRRAQLLALALLRVPPAADDPGLGAPEDEHAVLGEDLLPATVAPERRERGARASGLEAVEVREPGWSSTATQPASCRTGKLKIDAAPRGVPRARSSR